MYMVVAGLALSVDLPEIIIGDEEPPLPRIKQVSRILKGVAASKGICQGRTRKVSGVHDFTGVQEGDILVIPHSDISWTPVFCKAKAVISESGGNVISLCHYFPGIWHTGRSISFTCDADSGRCPRISRRT